MMTIGLFGTFFLLAILGVPIAIALGMAALIPVYFLTTLPLEIVPQRFMTAIDSFPLMAIPFFVIAGALLERGGVSKRLVRLAAALVGSLPGGIAIVTFLASAFFGAISGSATATVLAIGSIMVPAMINAGYPLRFALATVASAGYLGIIIPPSIPMVTYGISTSTSIGDIFMAGFFPGLILTTAMSCYALYYGYKNKMQTQKFSWQELKEAVKDGIWAILMPVIILGGIYGGIFTPTEAAAVAIFYGVIIGFAVYKELSIKLLYEILKSSLTSSGMIMFIVASASAFGFIMTRDMIPQKVAALLMSVSDNTVIIFLLINIMLLVVGTFMETIAAIMILSPILVTLTNQMGYSPIAFSIVMVVNLAIGMLTPPLGVNLFVAASLKNTKVDNVINIHLFWYILISLAVLMLLTYVPSISTFLPELLR